MPRYEDDLRTRLSKGRLPVTVAQYIQRLRTLNDNAPLTSMKFLMDFDAMTKKIDNMDKAFSTKTSYYTAICAVLSMYPKYSKLYKKFVDKTMSNSREIKKELETNEKNDKQKESIIPLKEIIEIRNRLKKEYDDATEIDGKVWDRYLAYILLCLYTMTPPRRNKDYSEMWFCFEEPKTLDKTKNYYIPSQRKFIFNNYKTASTYGQQVLEVPNELVQVLNNYIDTYQSVIERDDYSTANEFPLLVHFNGSRIHEINGITRLLNKAIGKKIGSGALRHIYVSDKFAPELKEMKTIASAMGHDLNTQREYIKTS
jgi:hypothetical protein